MADYLVGKGGGGKDRYKVGWNESKENANAYRVGGGGKNPAQADNKSLGGGDQDAVVGSKSAFNYSNVDTKDVGDSSDNMNFGGSQSSGPDSRRVGPGGEIDLCYSEQGEWSTSKDAMARRKARMEGYKQAMSGGDGYHSPTIDQVNIKK